MKRALVPEIPNPGKSVLLPDDESRHLIQVLRLRTGDEVELLDGKGGNAKAILQNPGRGWMAEITERKQVPVDFLPFELWVGILKTEAMEWLIEKATEMGVAKIVPFESQFTVVQTKNKGPDAFQARWQKISDQALKQCGRCHRMKIELPISFETALSRAEKMKFSWCDEQLSTQNNASQHLALSLHHAVWIGPEGGFHPLERDRLSKLTMLRPHEITRAHLGPLILRAETAAVLAIGILHGAYYGKGPITQNSV